MWLHIGLPPQSIVITVRYTGPESKCMWLLGQIKRLAASIGATVLVEREASATRGGKR
jgi:hypothetical protein